MVDKTTGLGVTIDSKGAKKGSKEVVDSFDDVKEAAGDLESSVEGPIGAFQKLKDTFTSTSVVLAGGAIFADVASQLASALGPAMQYEMQLAKIRTMTGESVEANAALDKSIKKLAVQYGAGLGKTADAMYGALAEGAMEAGTQNEALSASMELAAVTGTDAAVAFKAVTDIMGVYGDEVENAYEVADKLFTVMQQGGGDIREMASGMGYALSSAANLGVTMDEMLGIMSTMANEGKNVSQSLSGLRQVVDAIAGPSEKAKELAAEMGIEFSSAGLKAHGLIGIMKQVAIATDGDTEAINQLFTEMQAFDTAIALTADNLEGMITNMEGLEKATGNLSTAFEQIAKTTQHQFDIIATKMEIMFQQQGVGMLETLAPAIAYVARNLETLVGAAEMVAKTFVTWVLVMKGIPAMLSLIGGAVSLLYFGVKTLVVNAAAGVGVFQTLSAALGIYAGATTAATVATNLFRASLGALVAILTVGFFDDWLKETSVAYARFREGLSFSFDYIVSYAKQGWELVVSYLDEVVETAIPRITAWLKEPFITFLEWIATAAEGTVWGSWIADDARELAETMRSTVGASIEGLDAKYNKQHEQIIRNRERERRQLAENHAFAIAQIEEEFGKREAAQRAYESGSGFADKLKDTVSRLTDAQKASKEYAAALYTVHDVMKDGIVDANEFDKAMTALAEASIAYTKANAKSTAEIEKHQKSLAKLKAELQPVQTAQENWRKELEMVEELNAAGELDDYADAIERVNAKYFDAAMPVEAMIIALEEEKAALQGVNKSRADELVLIAMKNRASPEEVERIRQLVAEIKNLDEEMSGSAKTAELTADQMGQVFKNAATNIQTSFRDVFRDMLDKEITSFDDFASRLISIFKDMLAEMAAIAIAKPVIVPVVQQMANIMGMPGAGASVAAQFGGPAATGAAKAGGSSLLSAIPAPPAGWGFENVIGPSFPAAAAYAPVIGGGVFGYTQGGYAGAATGMGGAYAGAQLGGMTGTPIGVLIGGIVGGILGGLTGGALFGGEDRSEIRIATRPDEQYFRNKDVGYRQLGPFGYTGFETADGLGGAAKTIIATVTSLDQTLAEYFTPEQNVAVTDALQGRTGLKVSANTLSEDNIASLFADRVTAIFEAVDLPTDLIREAGDSMDQVGRAVQEILSIDEAVKGLAESVGEGEASLSSGQIAMNTLTKEIDNLTMRAEAAGFDEAFLENLDRLGEKAEEKLRTDFGQSIVDGLAAMANPLQAAMDAELRAFDDFAEDRLQSAKDLGTDIASVEELNAKERLAIVEKYTNAILDFENEIKLGILGYTDNLAASLMRADLAHQDRLARAHELGLEDLEDIHYLHSLEVQDIYAQHYDAIEREREAALAEQLRAEEAAAREREALLDSYRSALQSLVDYQNSLQFSNLSTLTPKEQFDIARQDFYTNLELARGGDLEAINAISDYAQNFLTQAMRMFPGTAEYKEIFKDVNQSISQFLTASADDPVVSAISEQNTVIIAGNAAIRDELELLREQNENIEERIVELVSIAERNEANAA